MSLKKILVLVMTFAMLISAFAPTLAVFAEETQRKSEENAKPELNYVSLGDSMSNGMGMEGYDVNKDNTIGYLEVAPDAYPSKFAAWLAGFEGDVSVGQTEYNGENAAVNLTQLATSGARAEDVYYILTKDTENEITPDAWTLSHFVNSDTWNHSSEATAEFFRDTIENADVISYALGNCNFGAFLFSLLMNIVGFGDEGTFEEDRENYGHYTLENALALIEADEDLTKLVNDIYNYAVEYCVQANIPQEWIEMFAGYTSYTAASYLVTTIKIIDLINEVNPDVEFIYVPLINNATDFNVDIVVDGETTSINMGNIISSLYTPINAYISTYMTVKQMNGEYSDLTFYYATLPVDENGETIQVETYAQAFETLYVDVEEGEEYPASREFCHDRFVKDVRGFIFKILFDRRLGAWELSAADVVNYEKAEAAGVQSFAAYIKANPEKSKWIALYLGVVDSILGAIKSNPEIDMNEIGITDFSDFTIYDLAKPHTEGLIEKIEDNAKNNVDPEMLEAVGTVEYASIPAMKDACYEELSDKGVVLALLSLYGRSLLADGLAGHTSEAGHDTLAQSLIEAYDNEYTMVDNTIDLVGDIANLLLENYDLVYEFAYKYVDGKGYIDDFEASIEKTVASLNGIISDVENGLYIVSDELKAKILTELNAAVDTLEEIKKVLEDDKAGTLVGLGAAVLALEDDLNTHLDNVINIAAQAGVDLSAAVEEAKTYFLEETLPVLINLTEEYAWVAVDFLLSNIDTIYYNFPAIVEGVYAHVLEKALWIQIIVGEAIDYAAKVVAETYFIVLDVLYDAYETAEAAIAEADKIIHELYITLVDIDNNLGNPSRDYLNGMTIVECAELLNSLYFRAYGDVEIALEMLNVILMDASELAELEFVNAIELYNEIVVILGDAYGKTEKAAIVASQIFSYVADFVVENDMGGNLKGHLDNIVDLIAETYRGTKDVNKVGAEIYSYVLTMFDGTFNTEYTITKDSLYVALGNEAYGDELAEMLHLSDKYYNFALDGDYLDVIADADLITIKLDNGEMIDFAISQLLAYGTELDWDKYLDANGQEALDELLEDLTKVLLETGTAQNLSEMLIDMLGEYADALIGAGVEITPDIVADILTYAAENLIYAYAELIDRVELVLDNVYEASPNATVVITGMSSSLGGLGLGDLGIDLSEYDKMINTLVDGVNVQLVAIAYAHENTIYVDSSDAADIYAALNVSCAHDYDDCEDAICNICGAERVAPGHKYGEWTVVKEATVDEEGYEERECTVCHHRETRSIAKLDAPAPAPQPEPEKDYTAIIVVAIIVVIAAALGVVIYRKKKAAVPSTVDTNTEEKSEGNEPTDNG